MIASYLFDSGGVHREIAWPAVATARAIPGSSADGLRCALAIAAMAAATGEAGNSITGIRGAGFSGTGQVLDVSVRTDPVFASTISSDTRR